MRQLITSILILFFCIALQGQDKHFSQYYALPLNLNPALAGAMGGKYRASIIYRNQWQTVTPNPFKTFGGSFDVKFPIGIKSDEIGAGMLFYSDKAGISNFNTNFISLSAAYHKALSLNNDQYLSAGFQIGVAQRSFSYENLTFHDQFDGESDYSFDTFEPLPANSFAFADISAGVFYNMTPSKRTAFQLGLSGFHVNLPNVSFNRDLVDRISPKIALNIGGQAPITRQVDILPRLLIYFQDPHLETNIGSNFKITVPNFSNMKMYLGGWVRAALDDENAVLVDALVVLAAFEIDGVRFGVSFDGNLSPLMKSSYGFGAFELSISYTGQDDDSGVVCPSF